MAREQQAALRRELGLDGDTAKVDEAREVRSSLARTRELMASGLESAGAALGALGDDDDALALLARRHDGMAGTLGAARRVLTKLQHQDRIDRWLMGLSVAVFYAVVLYVVWVCGAP